MEYKRGTRKKVEGDIVMKKFLAVMKKIAMVAACMITMLVVIFTIGRYGWRPFGFNACQSAGVERVTVSETAVHIKGFYPGSFPECFLGYYAEEIDGTLYVGFKFSAVFGIFETGDFDITIPTKGEIKEVCVKTRMNEYSVWSAEDDPATAWNAEQAYATVIGEYKTAIAEKWNGQQFMDAGLNYMIADYYLYAAEPKLGYAVTDLDEDGVKELLLGAMTEDEFYGKMIFALYTLDENGAPLLIFNGMERNRYYYAGGIRFANLGAGAFDSDFVTTLKFEDNEMIDMTYTTEPEDYVQLEFTAFSE